MRTVASIGPITARREWLFACFLPVMYGGRAIMFVPNRIRLIRTLCIFMLFIQGGVDFASLAFGGTRGGISRAAAGIHAALLVFAFAGMYGALRLKLWALAMHSLVTLG